MVQLFFHFSMNVFQYDPAMIIKPEIFHVDLYFFFHKGLRPVKCFCPEGVFDPIKNHKQDGTDDQHDHGCVFGTPPHGKDVALFFG